jgi:hypothetical protein
MKTKAMWMIINLLSALDPRFKVLINGMFKPIYERAKDGVFDRDEWMETAADFWDSGGYRFFQKDK